MRRDEFLAAHPVFARTRGDERKRFLREHPKIAEAWERITAGAGSRGPGPRPGGGQAEAGNTPGAVTAEQAARAATEGGMSARETITALLASAGLDVVADWAWEQYLDGRPLAAILLSLRSGQAGTDSRAQAAQAAYNQRFAGMASLRAKGRAIDEAEYVGMERSYAQVMRSYGLPAGFYDDPTDFASLIGGDVAVKELEDRVQMAASAMAADPRGSQLRSELSRLYGFHNADGLALAFFINPDKGSDLIRRQFQAASAAAASERTGFGSLSQSQAERAGGSGQNADDVFSRLAPLRALSDPIIGDSEAVSRDDLIAAGFDGDARAAERVERTQKRRTAAFRGGGSYAATQRGVTGLGSADG